jgi:hypothetical protein
VLTSVAVVSYWNSSKILRLNSSTASTIGRPGANVGRAYSASRGCARTRGESKQYSSADTSAPADRSLSAASSHGIPPLGCSGRGATSTTLVDVTSSTSWLFAISSRWTWLPK